MSTAESDRPLNPWISIWFSPRATLRWLTDHRPGYLMHLLIAVMLFSDPLCGEMWHDSGDRYSLGRIFAIAAVVAPPYMILYLYVFVWLVKGTGRLLGGRATAAELRTALAWAAVPSCASALLTIAQVLLFGRGLFRSDRPDSHAISGAVFFMWTLALMAIVLAAWWVVILVAGVAEAQRFAYWKAVVNYLLAVIAAAAPFVGLAVYFVGSS